MQPQVCLRNVVIVQKASFSAAPQPGMHPNCRLMKSNRIVGLLLRKNRGSLSYEKALKCVCVS